MAYIARSISSIQQQIIASKNAQPGLTGLNSPSQVSIWNLWTNICAISIALMDQILALYSNTIEALLTSKAYGSIPWIKAQLLSFQYSATSPQIVQINPDFSISYPVINTDLQVISEVSINTQGNNLVVCQIAGGTPPAPLSVPQVAAVQSYLNTIMPAGIITSVISSNPDQLYIQGTIFYNGMYSAIINTNVINAINGYLDNLPFGGTFVFSQLEDIILNVPGVQDINLTLVTARRDLQAFALGGNNVIYQLTGTNLDVNNRSYVSYAGYFIPEVSIPLTSSLTFIAQ